MESLLSDSYRIDRWDAKNNHWSIARAVIFTFEAAKAEYEAMVSDESNSNASLRLVLVRSSIIGEVIRHQGIPQ